MAKSPGIANPTHRATGIRFNHRRHARAGDDSRSRSRGAMRPKFCWKPSPMKIKGRREDRMRAAPAVSQAVCKEICCPRAYRFSGEHPASPTQWLYGLYMVAPVTGFLATVIPGKRSLPEELDASTGASGPHDFTVRNSSARLSPPRVHRSLPHVRDDGQRPFLMGQDTGVLNWFYLTAKAEYFFGKGWTHILG